MVLDHETYIMNLTEANASPEAEPVWKAEYSAKSAYGMASLQPQEWDRILRKMEDNDVLFDRFYRSVIRENLPSRHESNFAHENMQSQCRIRNFIQPHSATQR